MRTLIQNARIVDGTGAPARDADVLLEDEHIAELGGTSLPPDHVIDARGMVVAPGFIDMHSHSDFVLPRDGGCEAKLLQGVTTEVVGNCGLGVAPANERVQRLYRQIAPIVFGEPEAATFADLAAYRAALHERGIGVNAAMLIAHGNVRCHAMEMAQRAPTADELEHMRALVAQQMEQGAFGLSTGLVYPPGGFADHAEIVALAKVVAQHGGFYASHMRDEGPGLTKSVEETLRVGRDAGVSIQISHHKAAGRFAWGKVHETLRLVDEARAAGMDVNSDVYPYTAGSTALAAIILPLWAFEGTMDQALARLRDPAARARLIADGKAKLLAFTRLPGVLDKIVPKRLLLPILTREIAKLLIVSSVKKQHEYEGKSLKEIMTMRGSSDLWSTAIDLLMEEENAVLAIAHIMKEDDVQAVMTHAATMFGSDTTPMKDGKPHPRSYGTYPRVLEHYVKERGVLTLEQAIHKCTGMVARKVGLADRGVLRAGARADVIVFAPEAVRDHATYLDPMRTPDGFAHVFVNGAPAVRDGRATGARAGRVLARGAA